MRLRSFPRHSKVGGVAIGIVVFLVAFAVRAWWVLRVQNPIDAVWSDMAGYVVRAEGLLAGKTPGEPRVLLLWPWGTHAIVAGELFVFGRDSRIGIGLCHAAVGALAAPCASSLTMRFVRSRLAALFAGLLVALWQPHVVFSGFFLSEIWFTSAALLATVCFVRHSEGRGRGVLAGIFLAIAFVVRPQVVLSAAIVFGVIVLARLVGKRRFVRLPRRSLLVLLLPLVLAMGVSSERYHRLSGRWGLISMNDSVQRLFAATDVAKTEAAWTADNGERWTWWFNPTTKGNGTRATTEKFEGFIADPDILAKIQKRRLKRVGFGARVSRALDNVLLLAVGNEPWPEKDFKLPLRMRCQAWFGDAIFVVLGFALVGLWPVRRHPAAALAVLAQLGTIVFVAAFFFGEARHRVPYDPLVLVLAVAGLWSLGRGAGALASGLLGRRRRAAVPSSHGGSP
jgi:hypothetical protein